MILAQVLGDTCSYLSGEPLGGYYKIETIKTLNMHISAYQAIIKELHATVKVPLISKRVLKVILFWCLLK